MKTGVILDREDFGRMAAGHPALIELPEGHGGVIAIGLDLHSFEQGTKRKRRPVRKAKRARQQLFPNGVNCRKCGKHFDWPGQIAGHRARKECKKGR